jgi:hypothetical protein
MMTEEEWLACTDPARMLRSLQCKASGRLLRLFAVACCRHIWHLQDTDNREVVELGERLAEGYLVSADRVPVRDGDSAEDAAALGTLQPEAAEAADLSSAHASGAVGHTAAMAESFDDYVRSIRAERQYQSDVLRCIFGPFRPVAPNRVWLAWNDRTIPKLAQAIYDERAFDRLPILADALEEAGCLNADVLTHCRQRGEHVRGCWVVDLLLGKE